MKKNKLLTMLSISMIVLANAGMVLADAPAVPVDPSASTEVTPKPETPAEPSLPVPETPSEPSTEPEKPAEPTPENPGTKPSDPVVPSDPTNPSTEPSTEPEKPVEPAPNPSTPSSEDKKDEEKPKPEEKPKTTDEANQASKSQIGTTSTATGQVVQDVAPNKPVTTNSGVTIVGVQDSNPIIANADGTTSVVSAASIGATVNPDQTVSVTTASGEVKTLPKTGEKALISSLLSLIGLSLLAVGTKLKKLF